MDYDGYCIEQFLSTPSARRATGGKKAEIDRDGISIHALCEEGDAETVLAGGTPIGISIHALCEEGDLRQIIWISVSLQFLSTPSVRRATQRQETLSTSRTFLSTPSVRRATTPPP